ncbi:GerA spore germination protein [Melghirimyces profundicolus]|uniref:GerA spore germination protein n=1 Tax=Melghirimyces profundicolus TaxID=1242148 RepID=A0A2T6C8R3_9BACL|nr:spore germination protein [Melghirimyces profundicolus]PTX64702.1 GerA spore germination protein [Melghirimyces profundicolus]
MNLLRKWLAGLFSLSTPEDEPSNEVHQPDRGSALTVKQLQKRFKDVHDARVQQLHHDSRTVTLFYVRSLIDVEKLQVDILFPLLYGQKDHTDHAVVSDQVQPVPDLEQAIHQSLQGAVIVFTEGNVFAVKIPSTLSRPIETSEQEQILYGPKDSLSEQLEQNLTLIRRRLPVPELKSCMFNLGTLSKTDVALLYMEGITNPELLRTALEKTSNVDYDAFFDSSHIGAFLEDHENSVFPQFQHTDRPDAIAAALASGKIVWLVANSPFALIAPITFFDMFQSPEDYVQRWTVGSFLRSLRFFAFLAVMILAPMYVALTTHHYYSIPLQLLYLLMESRSEIPFTPFWEATFMLLTLEILKEGSLRMPTKSGQTLGIVGGIVIGQAAVEANIASNILIVFIALTGVASFLVPNYIMTTSSKLIQLLLLILAAWLGMWGVIWGLVFALIHLTGLTSLKQPYFAPLSPMFWRDWKDTVIRVPLPKMKHRPAYLNPVTSSRTKRKI